MRVIALVGKSGTGKSYRCTTLALEEKIQCIIDDGLLISGNKILAGKSAKHEKTKMASVKCAIFANEAHANQVREAISKHNVESILILGTSENMIQQIAHRLQLPDAEKIIYIGDIASEEEISTASAMRNKQGKHIIPAPVPEVKKQFSGYFLKSLIVPEKRGYKSENTVIRPTYSYLGSFRISPRAIYDICHFELSSFPEISRIFKIQSLSDVDGFIEISVEIELKYPCNIPEISSKIYYSLSSSIELSTSIIAKKVNIFIKTLDVNI